MPSTNTEFMFPDWFKEAIGRNSVRLSRTQRSIMEMILSRPIGFISRPPREIAELLNISISTLNRMAITLGYRNFRELQGIFLDIWKNRRTEIATFADHFYDDPMDNCADNYLNIINNHIEYTHNVATWLKQRSFQDGLLAACDIINLSRRIYVVGSRTSALLAELVSQRLTALRYHSLLIRNGIEESSEIVIQNTVKDCAIIICFPRYSRWVVDVSQYLAKRGVSLITITDSGEMPLSEISQALIIVPLMDSNYVYDNNIAAYYASNLLTDLLLARRPLDPHYLEQLDSYQSMSHQWIGLDQDHH